MSDSKGGDREAAGPSRGDLIEEGLILGIIVLAVAAYEWGVRDIPNKAMNLMVMRPVLVVAWLLVAAVAVRYVAVPLLRGGPAAGGAPDEGLRAAAPKLALAAMLVVYVATFELLPFMLTTGAFMAGSFLALGSRSVVSVVGLSAVTAVGLYLVGERLFGVALP